VGRQLIKVDKYRRVVSRKNLPQAGEAVENRRKGGSQLQTRVVGTSVPRNEGPAKLTGQARYIDDLSFPGMIFGATVRWQHGEAQ
jgi:hypothetical protein